MVRPLPSRDHEGCHRSALAPDRDARGIIDSEFSPIAKNCDSPLLVSVARSSLAASYAAAECGTRFLSSHHAKAVATVSAGTKRVLNLLPQYATQIPSSGPRHKR